MILEVSGGVKDVNWGGGVMMFLLESFDGLILSLKFFDVLFINKLRKLFVWLL